MSRALRLYLTRLPRLTLPALLYLPLILVLQWICGAYQTGFDGWFDEPRHYVTGLMVRDYIASLQLAHPLQFAENYYLHYPAVEFGHWPPVFYILQAAWTMFLPVSHGSMLVFMAVLTTATALLVHRCAEKEMSSVWAWMSGLLFIALPVTQMYAAMVMSEMPLALFSVAGLLGIIRYFEKETMGRAAALGLLISIAVLAKPSAWVLPLTLVLSALLLKEWKRLFSPRLWLAAALVAVLCLPFSVLTLNMVRVGQGQAITWSHTWTALPIYLSELPSMLGIPLLVLALCGIAVRFFWPLLIGRPLPLFWTVMAVYLACVLLFHIVVPTPAVPRKIMMAVPVFALFAVAGVEWMAAVFPAKLSFRARTTAAALVALSAFAVLTFKIPQRPASWVPEVARALVSRPDLRKPVVLVAAQQIAGGPIDVEPAVIAQIASLEPQRFKRYVLRASKHLVTGSLNGVNYHSLFETAAQVRAALDAIPVSLVLVHSIEGQPELPHQSLLRAMLKEYSSEWQQVYFATSSAGRETTEVYRRAGDLDDRPIRLQVHVSGGGLNLTIQNGK